ncbi:2-oxoglutarate dehydrogenase E1 component [Arsenophonus symbiont of Ornithomya chloropus]|uniref:2-oxoglutarate dehydrogenase E1 component n=1 Tax=Arsenophonus symbiont of Ornithomya chloropus TaxID=634121 RepID=UPI0032B12161
MHNSVMNDWSNLSFLSADNQSYIEQLYEEYLVNPNSVNKDWQIVFNQLPSTDSNPECFHSKICEHFRLLAKKNPIRYQTIIQTEFPVDIKQLKVFELINTFRLKGYQNACLDPLGLWKKNVIPDLYPEFYDLNDSDFKKIFNVSFGSKKIKITLSELYIALKRIYCTSIGAEYMDVTTFEEKKWIQKNLERTTSISEQFDKKEKRDILLELIAAEGLERYLGIKFPGAKRFSLEGADSLIPMLKELIRYANQHGTHEIVLGMAHRGRLNVLVNIFGKKSKDLFDEFSGKNKLVIGTGDVKYHQGFSSNFKILDREVHLSLAFNPSHLEIINPVIMGSARARRDRLSTVNNSDIVLPITIHGDAAVSGQGVVQEMLNMSQTRGYEVGGALRIVINNQIGFTTSNPEDARSTQFCTDIMKMAKAPIFHVNGDDPEAVVFITRLALDFRHKFKRDVVIDLVCYRRYGHNEADEPSVTQPIMYAKIKKHPTTCKLYTKKLITENIISDNEVTLMMDAYRDKLDRGDCVVDEYCPIDQQRSIWKPYLNHQWNDVYPININKEELKDLAKRLNNIPEKIIMQSRVKKIYNDRLEMANEKKSFDWGAAETLAYATLLDKGINVRLSGEDVSRGTFFHRHVVVHDQNNGSVYIPLSNISDHQGKFGVWDSVLSEEAVLAFEYGYASAEPRALIMWEAQFGDFANVAQVVIDQFISSGEQKWGRMCGLVILLPHGYEGQGPEHSSARLERYLQLCAEENMQVCIPSTPAQIYHILRRQVISNMRRPLIIMSPKSLLRHPRAISVLSELANGKFQSIITEIDLTDVKNIQRIILCSGKVYYDLLEQRMQNQQKNIAIIRIEQLYPFPDKDLKKALEAYEHVHDFVWCQEEPFNQGAWCFIKPNIRKIIPKYASLKYVGRAESAAPAVGYAFVHQAQQQILVRDALEIN